VSAPVSAKFNAGNELRIPELPATIRSATSKFIPQRSFPRLTCVVAVGASLQTEMGFAGRRFLFRLFRDRQAAFA
jgi:hypothetical protein